MNERKKERSWQTMLTGAALVAAALVGCATVSPPPAATPQDAPTEQSPATTTKSGAELWAQHCNRCHNFRSPASLSDEQWDVVLMHMRIRANLTGEEQRAILGFMQAGN